MSLDQYLKTWGSGDVKLVFPYTLFTTIEAMRECTSFPDIEVFRRDKDIDLDVYENCKKIFHERIALPNNDPNKWYNFVDYLKFYNLSDVLPTSMALINQFNTFNICFGLNPLQCMGLPQYSRKVMYKMYDPNAPSIFSFDAESTATKIFRSQTLGGLCSVYKRHVTLDVEEDAPNAAKYNKNGKILIF